jgi:hypothetical protein
VGFYFVSNSSGLSGSEYVEYEDKPVRIFPIDREPLEAITPHESVNEPDLEAFCDSFRRKKVFYKPILIDGESGTILDGTHRWAGLKSLGATHAPVIKFRYLANDEITVETWYPVSDRAPEQLIDYLEGQGYGVSSIDSYDFRKRSSEQVVMGAGERRWSIEGSAVSMFHDLESEFDFQYVQGSKQLKQFVDQGHVGFLRNAPNKEDVVSIAQRGEHVPPKYTCHEFPFKYPHIMTTYSELVPDD